jgi:hypothetical protein
VRQIIRTGNLPRKLMQFGMLDEESQNKLEEVLKRQPPEVRALLRSPAQVFECVSLTELSLYASLDDCAKGMIVDEDANRYYLVGLTIDPGRKKSKLEDTELMDDDTVEDVSARPARVMYFMEVSHHDFKSWQRSDLQQRQQWWDGKKERERLQMEKTLARQRLGIEQE